TTSRAAGPSYHANSDSAFMAATAFEVLGKALQLTVVEGHEHIPVATKLRVDAVAITELADLDDRPGDGVMRGASPLGPIVLDHVVMTASEEWDREAWVLARRAGAGPGSLHDGDFEAGFGAFQEVCGPHAGITRAHDADIGTLGSPEWGSGNDILGVPPEDAGLVRHGHEAARRPNPTTSRGWRGRRGR